MRFHFHLVAVIAAAAFSTAQAENYVTERNVSIDRCGTAWFISRFVDADATFSFFENGKTPPPGITYAFFGSKYFNKGADCTFAVMVKAHGKESLKALRLLNEQFNDIFAWRAGPDSLSRFLREEIASLRKETASDEETFRHMFVVFDLMYLAYGGDKNALLNSRHKDIDNLPIRILLDVAEPGDAVLPLRDPTGGGGVPADGNQSDPLLKIYDALLPLLESGQLKPLTKEWCLQCRESGWNKETSPLLLDWLKIQEPKTGVNKILKRIYLLVADRILDSKS